MSDAKPVPDGYHTVTPYLGVDGAAEAIAFYERAFGAEELFRIQAPDGQVAHAEIRIGDSPIMLADSCEKIPSPKTLGASCVYLHLYVEDVDASFARALEAGCTESRPVADQFYGDRTGHVIDPYGHQWTLSTHKVDMTVEQVKARAAELFGE